jgi:hypothetical protein
MKKTVFAIVLAALACTAVAGTSQAAPIAPLPAGVAADADHGNVTKAWYYHYYHHRHCWVGRWGHVHCHW